MNLINKVYDTLKFKKSDEYCAEKVGISVESYRALKTQVLKVKDLLQQDLDELMKEAINKRLLDLIDDTDLTNYTQTFENQIVNTVNTSKERVIEFKENLDDGTAEIKGIAFSEPQSPEEIIRILKIDTDKWKLSQYWNKQQRDHWLVSALVTQKALDSQHLLENCLAEFVPKPISIENVVTNPRYTNESCAVLSVQDLHFGKDNNEDITDVFTEAIKNLVYRAYHSHHLDEIVYVVGGDLLNMDTFNGTTTSGTPVDSHLSAQDTYNKAFDALHWSIGFIKQFCNKLHVVYVPGNHDRLSSYHVAHALSKCFSNEDIIFNVSYSERKVVVYGSNFLAFEHGDVHSKDTPLVYATEFPKEWGNTVYRTLYTGHYHKKKTVEYITQNERNGFQIRTIPSLSATDYWHYHNKYTGSVRCAVMEIHDHSKGKISELIYSV